MDPGYLVRRAKNPENPRELELIESLMITSNGDFNTREHIQEGLAKRYLNFDLVAFERCVEELLRIERGMKDGSIGYSTINNDDDIEKYFKQSSQINK